MSSVVSTQKSPAVRGGSQIVGSVTTATITTTWQQDVCVSSTAAVCRSFDGMSEFCRRIQGADSFSDSISSQFTLKAYVCM